MKYRHEEEKWGAFVVAYDGPTNVMVGHVSVVSRESFEYFQHLGHTFMAVGPFRVDTSSVDYRRLFRFLGLSAGTDSAYPAEWAKHNEDMIRRLGGCAGWTYRNSMFGRPLYRGEVMALLEAALWEALSTNDRLMNVVTFTFAN